jgi:hypothetical protein
MKVNTATVRKAGAFPQTSGAAAAEYAHHHGRATCSRLVPGPVGAT